MNTRTLMLLAASLLVLGAAACDLPKGGAPGGATALKPNAVKVEFYVMSQCPYGKQVEDGIKPVLEKIPGYVDLQIDYIVTPQEGGKFKSLHGQPEVDGNIAQLCAKKVAPDKYFDFITCQNEKMRQIPKNTADCAKKTGIDLGKLNACKDGPEGKALLTASAAKAKERKARGSPTIYLAGKKYSGGRRGNDFLRAICDAMTGEKPKACTDIPPPPVVNLIVLNDARCTDRACKSVKGAMARLKSTFPGLKTTELDYGTDEGKKLFTEAKLEYLPALLFDKSVEQDQDGMKQIGRYLRPQGDYKLLAMGGKFDPTAEICDNEKDDTGNGKIDCADETCKETLVCREEIKGKLDVFVMSQCPYGVKALDAMPEVLENFKGNIDFDINFIATDLGDGKFKALHGQPEVDENIRELCAIKHYPKNHKYMDYILCRNKNIRSKDWQSCAKDGIDVKVMETCFTGGEGVKLHAESIKLAKSLGVTGSPTWIANNRHKFSGIDAETVRKNFCKHNPGTANCDKTLSANKKGVKPGACGK